MFFWHNLICRLHQNTWSFLCWDTTPWPTRSTSPTPHLWHIPFLWHYFHLLPCRCHFLPFRDKPNSFSSRGLNRKRDSIASNPASYVTLNPPSKKQLASKRKPHNSSHSILDWQCQKMSRFPSKPRVRDLFPHFSKASVKTIALISFNASQSLEML